MAYRLKSLVLGTVLVTAVLAVTAYIKLKPAQKTTAKVNIVTKDQPTLGKTDAPIHIISFEDLKCVGCKNFSNTVFPQIEKKYIDTGKAKFTFINLAFIPGSLPVANAARCLYQQDKSFFFPFIKYAYRHQPPENQNWGTTALLLQFANTAVPKANMTKLSDCMISGKYNQFINKNMDIAKKAMSVIQTPSVYINGHKLNRLDMKSFEQMIETKQ